MKATATARVLVVGTTCLLLVHWVRPSGDGFGKNDLTAFGRFSRTRHPPGVPRVRSSFRLGGVLSERPQPPLLRPRPWPARGTSNTQEKTTQQAVKKQMQKP